MQTSIIQFYFTNTSSIVVQEQTVQFVSIQENLSAVWFVRSLQQLQQGRLSAAGSTNQSYCFTCIYCQRQTSQHLGLE